ncbi:hypothetical protein NMG60_11003202 [Bertholletia excelsa]
MGITSKLIALSAILASLFAICPARACSNYSFTSNKTYSSCRDLPYVQAHLHWNYIPSTKQGWDAQAINLTGTGTAGSQALVAFRNSNWSAKAYLKYRENEITIFAVVGPLEKWNYHQPCLVVWKFVSSDTPWAHSTSGDNVKSMGTLDFLSG